MKKWSYFLIALFTLSACEKEPLENPRVTDHQAILDAHTAFYDEVVANLIEGIRQHPDLEVEKLLAKDPEALLAELEARGILDRAKTEKSIARLQEALKQSGYFDDEQTRMNVDNLLMGKMLSMARRDGKFTFETNSVETTTNIKNSTVGTQAATPCYDNLSATMDALDLALAGCAPLITSGWGVAVCAGLYLGGIAIATDTYERCIDSTY